MKRQQKTLLLWVVVILLMAFIMKHIDQGQRPARNISFSQFIQAVENNHVQEVTFQGEASILGRFKEGY